MVDVELLAKVPKWALDLYYGLGYLGVFFVSFIGSATIILPLPSFILVFVLGAVMNPWLVALSAAAGNTLGEMTGYWIGKGGGKLMEKKYDKHMEKYRKWFKKDHVFFLIILFGATPLPDDVVGIVCGAFDYDVKKFLVASFIGKLILNLALAFGGLYGIRWILTVFGV
jgi:membrane protein YqaA with SNARE-associated domain